MRTAGLALLAAMVLAAGAARAAPPESGPERHRGHLVLGHEMRSFTPCGERDAVWVFDRSPQGELSSSYQELATQPYQAIYVEVLGELGPRPTTGFGADFARSLTVRALERAVLEGKGCAEPLGRFTYRAVGNEPFWSAEIATSGISVTQLGGSDDPPRLEFPYNPPTVGAAGRVYVSSTELPHNDLRVELQEATCIDTMSGARFRHRADVSLNGRNLRGCAYAGEPPRAHSRHEIRSLEAKRDGCGPEGAEVCTWFRFDYPAWRDGLPEIARRRVAAAVASWLHRPLREGEEPAGPPALIDRWEAQYRAFKARFPDAAQRWTVRRAVSVMGASPAYLSLAMQESWDLGGAHPNQTIAFATFRSETGDRLNLRDLLRPGAGPALTDLAEDHFRRARGIAAETPWAEAGFHFSQGRFEPPGNFALALEGLVFHFNPYEIAPYADGPTTFTVPASELKDLLEPEFLAPP